jgi:hypothetical protein
MKILVAGIGKSGTTGLYSLVKNSLPGDPLCAFEPPLAAVTGDEVLVKSLVGDVRPNNRLYALGAFGQFDKRLFIVRDPRDRLVSGTLYSAATSRFQSRDKLDEWLKLLEQKEADPSSVSLLELRGWRHRSLVESGYGQAQIDCCGDYDHCLVKYEDFVEGRVADVEKYLGFKLTGTADVDPNLLRVVRSKRAGCWRNWFTPEDVEVLKTAYLNFMAHFGYDCDDWNLNDEQAIDPRFGSEYVSRVWSEIRREQ